MAINFPDSPNNGDSFTSNNKTWVFDGTVWNITSGTNSVADGAITAAKLASNAVHQTKLASNLSGITITTTANRDTDITSPFTGQFAFLTDTNAFIRWDGSAWVTAIVTAPTEAPTSLTLDSATVTTATISFAAGATGGSAITNYQYALSTNGGSSYGSYNALNPADATSPITITGLALGTAYYIKLKAVNAQGVSTIESNALSFSTASLSVEYLVIAGGGGGGGALAGGGGGAGGYRTNVTGATSGANASAEAALTVSPGTYLVTVGTGGAGAGDYARGTNGTNSVFSTITSLGGGGGGGGGNNTNLTGLSGGSGGGGTGAADRVAVAGGAGTATQGLGGGAGFHWGGIHIAAGGGGGAGVAGSNSTTSSSGLTGAGGNGLSSSITGSAVTRAGGGSGGAHASALTVGAAGTGGGGTGGYGGASTSGTVNTGGGGGGGGNASIAGSAGGSGVVILRYLTADATSLTFTVGAGLTSATTTSGSYTVRTFTAGTGNLVIS